MKIVGVTACTAGIAHTYMAQSALEKAAKADGYQAKIETQGAMGAENELTEDEIANADVVILGVDVSIEGRERFDGKKVYETSVSRCVTEPQKVIEDAINS
ncbi:PTS fructose transporter subunit IIB [Lacticaseibacillus jixianensis]|uniref:PTS fructose transporter subunit IIB n=1 Tax=Lacticaseibacillus jixianensis TaxID=2486012 RepID=A0ABW4B9B3_9LACO|nr:PTS fructose transporter subunit IIB [Lacticaseibacillus jixianensis]